MAGRPRSVHPAGQRELAGTAERQLSGSRAEELWLFGYGSLVWRPAIAHAERQAAVLTHWSRRFWQGSTDHRGVPGAPGRVVTLIPEADARCWGAAYRVQAAHWDAVLLALDLREKGGYRRRQVQLELVPSGQHVEALVYVATERNPNYLGPAPLPEIAEQVLRSAGPSGSNTEYVLRLADALHDMDAEDAHVFALAERLRREVD